ncbi:MAG: hypothetical protein FWH55_08160, partial [Oscillospiraceae bacterium]|nr:hypothetical protein [Oscillospiraceae bacterium]
WIVTTPATCEEEGEETRVDNNDPTHVEKRPVAALGHDWGEWVETTPATCEEDGEETRVCANDPTHVEKRPVAALGHDWGEWEETTPATCEEDGEETRVCANNPTHVETRIVEAIGHDWGEWVETTPATCEEDGEETRVCANDPTHVETRIVEALGHDYVGVVTIPATCEAEGMMTYTCSRCGDSYTQTIPMLDDHVTIINMGVSYSTPSYSGSESDRTGSTTVTLTFVLSNDSIVIKTEEFTGINSTATRTLTYDIGCYKVTVDTTVTVTGSNNSMTIVDASADITNEELNEDVHGVKKADYSAVEAAIAAANALNKNLYVDFSGVDAAIAAVVYGLGSGDQAIIDGYASAINAAIAALVYKGADYSTVEAAISAANALSKNLYVDFSGVDAAIAAVKYGLGVGDQAIVDGYANAINAAMAALVYKGANYSVVETAIAAANALNKNLYVDFSGVDAAIAAVKYGLGVGDQAIVNGYAGAINAAIAALVYKEANYSTVEAALAATKALNKNLYVDFSGVDAAIAAVKYGLGVGDQAIVDGYARAINAAMAALIYKGADYSTVEVAIAAANALNKNLYVDFNSVDAAIAAVVYGLGIGDQAIVDGYANAINAAIAALVYKGANYLPVEAAIAAAKALNKNLYVDFSGVDAAIAAVVYGLSAGDQAIVDGYARAINAAMAALVYKGANYSAVEAAIAAAKALNKNLYVDFSGVDTAIAAVVFGLGVGDQAIVDGYANAINSAIAALVYKEADYSAVEAVMAAVKALNKNLYVDFSGVDAAIAAVVYGLGVGDQSIVDGYAIAINTAMAALVYKEANYSAVEEAIAATNALNKNLYVDFSGVDAAKAAVIYSLGVSDQAIVDGYASAINTAIAALVYKGADYSMVEAAIATAKALNKDLYVDFNSVDAAIATVVYGLGIGNQAIVDGYANAINTTIAALVLKPTGWRIVNATTSAKNIISITQKSNNVVVLKFQVIETYFDGSTELFIYSINLNGNNVNIDGRYTFTEGHLKGYTLVYDIKGNGNNIKEFRLIK